MSSDYQRIETAIRFIEQNAADQPTLDEIADQVELSPFHFQRLFRRWAGISPKRFLQFVTVEHAKELLKGSSSVMETAFEVGLSGPARLHDAGHDPLGRSQGLGGDARRRNQRGDGV